MKSTFTVIIVILLTFCLAEFISAADYSNAWCDIEYAGRTDVLTRVDTLGDGTQVEYRAHCLTSFQIIEQALVTDWQAALDHALAKNKYSNRFLILRLKCVGPRADKKELFAYGRCLIALRDLNDIGVQFLHSDGTAVYESI